MLRIFLLSMCYIAMENGVIVPKVVQSIARFLLIAGGAIPRINAERYKLTQTQRRLERDVRNAKREQAMLEAAGDEEGAKLAAQKVWQKQR